MNKTLNRIGTLAALLLLSFGCLHAQATLNTTTLASALTANPSSALPGSSTDVIYVASTSNFVQNSVGQWTTLLYVDFEALDVVQVLNSSTGQVRVVRGAYGTKAGYHNSGALVYVGYPAYFGGSAAAGAGLAGDQGGACVASTVAALPYININDGKIFQCLSSGQWIQTGYGTMGSPPAQLQSDFCTGTVAATSQTIYLNDAACSGATTALAPTIQVSRGTIYGLSVSSSVAVHGGTGADVLTVYKNGSATALTCTIAASATSCTDNTHSLPVVPGDLITYQFVNYATSDTAANIGVSVEKQ